MVADFINGMFEMCGGFFILLHILKLYKDKKVRGVSIVATTFFASWGVWNLYYYPSLSQWWSFLGGCVIVVMNTAWILMMLYYNGREVRGY